MKECPNCKKIYTDDLFFCHYDGVSLTEIRESVDPNAPTEAAFNVGGSLRTEVLPAPIPVPQTVVLPRIESTPSKPPSKLPYLAIGALTLTCIILAASLVVINLDRIFPPRETTTKVPNDAKSTPTPVASNTQPATNAVTAVNQPNKKPVTIFNPTGKWKGEWSTRSGTLLDFELNLTEAGNNGLEGQIKWTMRRTARPDKMDKIGLSATEYVRGSYDPATGIVIISGYSKDDPNGVLVMLDVYKLNVSSDGHVLTGLARNGGKWNGHLRLTR